MVTISLATNDYRNGDDLGRVSAVHLDDAIELAWGESGTEPRYSIEGKTLKISRRQFPILGHTDWCGNWCWTGVSMTEDVAADLLNYLSLDDRWHCDGGWCDLTDFYTQSKVTRELLLEASQT